jgi:NAD(P)-dependent dehydrogenase (short-subunit alcohol dehydrogenase family)
MSRPDAVIVTGAGRGLGKAVAERCAADGLPVLCLARTSTADTTRDALRVAGAEAESLVVDLADPQETQRRVGAWIDGQRFRRLAVVCAAGTLGARGGTETSDLADWGRTFATNVLGNFAVIQALLPRMLAARYGRIVTLAGGGAAYAYPLFSGYALSKTATVRATENLAEELRGRGDFLAVCLAPGAMETEMLACVRAAGAEVKTTVALHEPVDFIASFIRAETCSFSGRFVHVRDAWPEALAGAPVEGDRWLLRRIEW